MKRSVGAVLASLLRPTRRVGSRASARVGWVVWVRMLIVLLALHLQHLLKIGQNVDRVDRVSGGPLAINTLLYTKIRHHLS